MHKRRMAWFVLIALLALLAWAPWLSRANAEKLAVAGFASAWQGVADGCGINCLGCGVSGSTRIPFGYLVQLEYACGLIPADLPAYHRTSTAFVSFLGSVHGYPVP